MFRSFFQRVSKSSFLWGGLAGFGFYSLIHQGIIGDATVYRYCAMHPVEYVITIMFFVGIAGLLIRFFDLRQQWGRMKTGPILEKMGNTKLAPRESTRLLEHVCAREKKQGISLYTNRIYTLLVNIRHAESAEKLDDELRILADEEYIRGESEYGLTKMIIWAIPILGFLGTVIGIAVAMGNLSPEALEESLPKVMAGLTIAFDTTALALALSMVLYFSQFLIWKDEQKLLDEINRRAEYELRGRFETLGTQGDSTHIAAVRKMIEAVLDSIEQLVTHQSEIWDQAMNAANSRFVMMAAESSSQLKSTLTIAMRESAETHAQTLLKGEQQLLAGAKENIKQMTDLQDSMIQQTDILRQVVQATGEVAKLEDRLNQNLAALAGSHHFAETVNSLAAAIHLLNTKLADTSGGMPQVQITTKSGKGFAA